MNSRGLLIVAVVAIAILLVGSTAFSHSAEAKKRQPSEIKVYSIERRRNQTKVIVESLYSRR